MAAEAPVRPVVGVQPRHRGGRHRLARPRRWGRAASLTLLSVLVPGSALAAVGWYLVRRHRDTLVRLAVDPAWLVVIMLALVLGWGLWLGLICLTYWRTRPVASRLPARLAGVLSVGVLCALVTAPMAVGARYAMVQRSLVTTVFHGEKTQTTPDDVTRASPWGTRDRVNVLLLGGDGAVGRPGVRTDSMNLASIDVHTGETILFSLPRNLVRVPFPAGTALAKAYPEGFQGPGSEASYFLNAVYRDVPLYNPGILGKSDNEGADAIKLAVAGALGIHVDYYVLVNLSGFKQIVDAVGGITVNINEPVPIGGNTDLHIPPDDYLEPGPNQRLDGFKALWFTRGRYGSTDYKRMQRQRCALEAMRAEIDPMTLLRRYTALAEASKKIVRTDIPRSLVPAFVELGDLMKGTSLRSVGFERTDEFNPNDPDFDYVHRTVQAALQPHARTSSSAPPTSQSSTDAPDDDPAADQDLSGRAGGSKDTGSMTETASDCGYHPVSDQ